MIKSFTFAGFEITKAEMITKKHKTSFCWWHGMLEIASVPHMDMSVFIVIFRREAYML